MVPRKGEGVEALHIQGATGSQSFLELEATSCVVSKWYFHESNYEKNLFASLDPRQWVGMMMMMIIMALEVGFLITQGLSQEKRSPIFNE